VKPATAIREVVSSGVLEKGVFTISMENQAHIMGILRDGLYTDTVLAILREYSSNAWDAHREAGKGDVPIKVVIPTRMDPTLIIRDHGKGLSEEEVFQVYTQYGESTKRDTDDAVGMLGIGSKSGFAYSDTFTVTSWNGGWKRVYVAVLDESDVGEIQKLHEEKCGEDESGLEIKIPAKVRDVPAFQQRARHLFHYFRPRPEINIDLPGDAWAIKESGFIDDTSHQWVAIMGCVPYKIDLHQLMEELEKEGVLSATDKIRGGLFFKIGEVRISANREELKYTDSTKNAIAKRMRALFNEYIEDTLKILRNDHASGWDRRVQASFAARNLQIPLPKKFQGWAARQVYLWGRDDMDPPKSFSLWRDGSAYSSVYVDGKARLILKDDSRVTSGFQLSLLDTVVIPRGKATLETVKAELKAFVDRVNLDGIPIKNISEIPWHRPYYNGYREYNPKHRVATFRLTSTGNQKLSDNWTIEQREPADDDVYVIISSFRVVRCEGFYSIYNQDRIMAKALGLSMPEVYGYKTTARKPVNEKDLKGTCYLKWRKGFFRDGLTFKWKELIRHYEWESLIQLRSWRASWESLQEIYDELVSELGTDHGVTKMIGRSLQAKQALTKAKKTDIRILQPLARATRVYAPAPRRALEKFYRRYPLFKVSGAHLSALEGDKASHWLEYIKLVDRDQEANKP